jgi:phthalate 4,5-dioxygenase oxygenase subunit
MLSREDNDVLCKTGRGTLMGDLIRSFWLPFLQSSELPAPDCDPVRLTLLNEKLVAFRDTQGRVGLVEQLCVHRNADLFFGRNEENGLRCPYHGWKFDVSGQCVDMPTEDVDSNFMGKVGLVAYPVIERNEVLWTYMGPQAFKPEMPDFEFLRVEKGHLFTSYNLQESNFAQAIEGGIDSAHSNYLHSTLDAYRRTPVWREMAEKSNALRDKYHARDQHPKFFAEDTDFGVLIGARRETGEDLYYWRYNLFLMPFYNMAPAGIEAKDAHAWVPIDDESCMRWSFTWRADRPLSSQEVLSMAHGSGIHSEMIAGTHVPVRNKSNDYLIDREEQRNVTYTGINGTGEQDFAVQEGMGTISDRTHEHLGITDIGIIRMRQMLLREARNLREGTFPISAQRGKAYYVRAGDILLPRDARWNDNPRTAKALSAMA